VLFLLYTCPLPVKCIKESWPKWSGFGLPLKGAVLVKAVQVKSV